MPRTGSSYFVVLLVFGLAGCRTSAPVTFTHWATPHSLSNGAANTASNKLMSAGDAVNILAKESVRPDSKGRVPAPITTRTTFFPKQKAEAIKIIGKSRSAALSAASELGLLNYTPLGLAPPPSYLSGLRLIGLSFLWDIDEAIANHDFDKAIVACGSSTRLGCALMSGGASEASLGAAMINQARQKMVPVLGSFSGLQLGKLGSAIQKASAHRPAMEISIENERDNMLLSLQQAQDFFEKNQLDRLQVQLGVSAKDSIDMLQAMEKDQEKGRALFNWIGSDISARTEWYLKRVKNPRQAGVPPKKDETKSKLMLYRYFGTNIENLVPVLQATYCRTELFVLECYLKQKMKLQKELPASLDVFSKSATIDPFTGEPFYYKRGISSYLLYSAGEDGFDDGGDTDATCRRPDMKLEQGHS